MNDIELLGNIGDGAYLKTKSTSLAVFVAEDVLSVQGGPVKLGLSKNTDLSE